MRYKNFISFVLIWLPVFVNSTAQTGYKVGVSQCTIEPDRSLISLHLGGYGAPRDGRFSLQWTEEEFLPDVTSLGGSPDKVFIIKKGELFFRDLSKSESQWSKAGNDMALVAVAGSERKIYGVDASGKFYDSNYGKIAKWRRSSIPDKPTVSLTFSLNCLISLDAAGKIWMVNPEGSKMNWSMLTSPDGTISIASIGRKLYALTGDGVIFQCEPASDRIKWLKAAYRNNATITEDIRMIAIAGKCIYGISNEGYFYSGGHRSEGNLSVRSMALSSGSDQVVIITADICGLNDSFTRLVKESISKKYGLPSQAVFINSSHTHFAPVSQEWLTWQEANQRPDSTYLYSTIWNAMIRSVDEAFNSQKPARLFFGRGKCDIGYNRSLPEHPELYDSSVDVLKVKYTDTGKESILFLASCHPVFSTAGKLHYTISANYPGVARKLVEERTGTVNSIFIQGTAGDINPGDNGEYITGEKLANEVVSVTGKPMTEITGEVSYFLDTLNIPVEPWSKSEILRFREENLTRPGDIYAEKNVKWSDIMLERYEKGTMPSSLPVYVHTVNIGNWKLVGFSRETTTEYGFGVKKLWPDKLVSVAGYTNDVSSYLPSSLHIEAKNYEGYDSFFWYGMPAVFPVNVDKIILNAIESLNR